MNRPELISALEHAGVDKHGYYVAGGPAPAERLWEGALVLETDADGWVVGSRERGVLNLPHRFGSEAEACAYMYRALTAPRAPMGTPPTAEEMAASQQRADELLRKLEQQREEWLRQQNISPQG